jgi:hypothetical protein
MRRISAATAVAAMSIIGTMTFADHVAATQGSPIFGVKFVAVRDR